jgi:DNA-binding beta-propeller fold protein YncE
VNNFHRDVIRFTPSAFPPTNGPPPTTYGGALSFDTAHPTGVAVEPTTNRVYVDARTYIAAYEPNGTPVMDGLEPLRIGLGSLGSGYGVTVTASGRLYVPDATTNTVKVYEPTIDKVNPVATIKGPVKGFVSLRDSSVAVDPSTGFIYVVDNEEPEAVVDIFNGGNAFLGVLKYKLFDALPAGIATAPSGGVFVTSGNTDQAAIYGYGANPQTNVALPPTEGATIKITGTGRGAVTSSSPAISCTSSCGKGVLTGSQLTLTATPSSGSEFAGWSGAGCPDSGLTCTVTMTEERTVEASFEALPPSGGGASLPPAGASPGPRASDTSSSSPPAARPHRHRHRHHKSKHRHRKAR